MEQKLGVPLDARQILASNFATVCGYLAALAQNVSLLLAENAAPIEEVHADCQKCVRFAGLPEFEKHSQLGRLLMLQSLRKLVVVRAKIKELLGFLCVFYSPEWAPPCHR